MKVLLIDDDAFALKLLQRQMASLGHADVALASCAVGALTMINEGARFDIILSDLQMPGMDGVELLRALKESRYDGELILVSGEDRSILKAAEQLARAHGLRVLGQLEKPVDPLRLARILASHTGSPSSGSGGRGRPYSQQEVLQAVLDNQLVCHCQPQVSLSTGELAGVEILVRWQHPVDGLVFPDRFIGVAEEHGLIDDITRLVLRDALQQARPWFDTGFKMHVAINISMQTLNDLQFPDFVVAIARETGIPPSSLLLEITESRLMTDLRASLDILARLRLKQINLSIDDFGTGHSSLAQLRVLPFNELKIDRSFVHGASHDSQMAVICEASLDIAKKLGMRSVAEGVEDIDDWNFLRANGCELAQGYLIGQPMPIPQLAEWLSGWERRCRDMELLASQPSPA